eukprot:Gb_39178 [translate_table: standard]
MQRTKEFLMQRTWVSFSSKDLVKFAEVVPVSMEWRSFLKIVMQLYAVQWRVIANPLQELEGIKHTLVIPEETEEIEMDSLNLDEEECLMRCTLAAHSDYNYTQHYRNP